MAAVRVLVLRAPGINCEEETCHAWRLAGAEAALWRLNELIDAPDGLDRFDILTIPGGFSFGDDISAGRIFGNRLSLHLGDRLHEFVERDRLVLGICNGFQVLLEAGLLDDTDSSAEAGCTLAFNDNGRYACRWVTLATASNHCVFLEPGRAYFLPMAHAEGRVAVAPGHGVDDKRIALQYTAGVPRVGADNPNGSVQDIAGLTDRTGRVLGLMPHPERFVDPTHHPFWTATRDPIEPDGLAIFRAAVQACR